MNNIKTSLKILFLITLIFLFSNLIISGSLTNKSILNFVFAQNEGDEDIESDEEELEDQDDNEDVDENDDESENEDNDTNSSRASVKINNEVFSTSSTEQNIQVSIKNGKASIKIKVKNANGEEEVIEKEVEGETNISVTVKVESGEHHIQVKTAEGKVILNDQTESNQVQATTSLPINVDIQNNQVTIETSSGTVTLKNLPADVVEILKKLGTLDLVNSINIEEETKDGKVKIIYKVSGNNKVKFLRVFNVSANISANVDSETSGVTIQSQPWYLKYLGFLFSSN
ncbi:MAG: hypothetical protein UT08_C0003G0071 [Candidatus Woesebacteria bacterium GW2011_GWB1_38_8]|uniref:Adhesin domain-containing protein n=1 Tax=Candidatus Woesebacteria bacterium GW2011_GWB1_38_8 TaxID=1618570 RepID=A0A0G0L1Q5_9BACT|nr:MAG: hypothetical protein UT08_C0003G0071 [Candidatus Woesebacteria bacterium GW2011_GWB1_38_8]